MRLGVRSRCSRNFYSEFLSLLDGVEIEESLGVWASVGCSRQEIGVVGSILIWDAWLRMVHDEFQKRSTSPLSISWWGLSSQGCPPHGCLCTLYQHPAPVSKQLPALVSVMFNLTYYQHSMAGATCALILIEPYRITFQILVARHCSQSSLESLAPTEAFLLLLPS